MDEMIELFHDNDWTTAKIYGDDERTPEMNAAIQHIKRLIKVKYDAFAKEMGRKKHPVCYSKDHPLMKLQDGSSEVVACAVEKLMIEHPDICDEILNYFNYLTDPDIDKKADEMCAKAIKLMMPVQQYDKIADITEEKPAYEDYSNIQNNDPKKDFIKNGIR